MTQRNIYTFSNVINLFRKHGIKPKLHKVAVACIYACDDNQSEAIKLFKSLNKENIEEHIDSLVEATLNSYESWMGDTIYECKDFIISGRYSSTRSVVEDDIRESLLAAFE